MVQECLAYQLEHVIDLCLVLFFFAGITSLIKASFQGISQGNKKPIGWFQKISIPIPPAASRNSEGEGGYVDWNSEDMGGFTGLEFRRHGGICRRGTSSLV